MNSATKSVFAAVLAALCGGAMAQSADTIGQAVSATKPIVDTRLRFETVDQDPFAQDADAITWRARVGFETGKVWNTSLLAEGEFLWPLKNDYNSTTNGATNYPIVADPESYELNRLQLTNTSIADTIVTLGRQRVLLDDQRFVGNVGWRQNEQTFDSLRIVNKSLANTTVDVAYVTQVNRVFGKESLQGRYEGDTVLANVGYQFPVGRLTAFGYWIDIEPLAGVAAAVRDASETFGVRFAGEKTLETLKFGYAASYASQSEYADNPLAFDLDYYLAEGSLTYREYSVGLGLEVLEGDGVKGFTTPLATLHKFQGWADKFLATPSNGIEDRYLTLGGSFKAVGPFDTLGVLAAYHVYDAERTSLDYGTELNLQLQAKWKRFSGLIKYADYDADDFLTDTAKFWVQLEYVW